MLISKLQIWQQAERECLIWNILYMDGYIQLMLLEIYLYSLMEKGGGGGQGNEIPHSSCSKWKWYLVKTGGSNNKQLLNYFDEKAAPTECHQLTGISIQMSHLTQWVMWHTWKWSLQIKKWKSKLWMTNHSLRRLVTVTEQNLLNNPQYYLLINVLCFFQITQT